MELRQLAKTSACYPAWSSSASLGRALPSAASGRARRCGGGDSVGCGRVVGGAEARQGGGVEGGQAGGQASGQDRSAARRAAARGGGAGRREQEGVRVRLQRRGGGAAAGRTSAGGRGRADGVGGRGGTDGGGAGISGSVCGDARGGGWRRGRRRRGTLQRRGGRGEEAERGEAVGGGRCAGARGHFRAPRGAPTGGVAAGFFLRCAVSDARRGG